MLLTLGILFGCLVTVIALSLGDLIVDLVVDQGLLPVSSGTLISVVRWPILLLFASFLVQQLYYLLPDQRPRWRLTSTGSVSAVLARCSPLVFLQNRLATLQMKRLEAGMPGACGAADSFP